MRNLLAHVTWLSLVMVLLLVRNRQAPPPLQWDMFSHSLAAALLPVFAAVFWGEVGVCFVDSEAQHALRRTCVIFCLCRRGQLFFYTSWMESVWFVEWVPSTWEAS